jgi:excisionase family DNA binding protein
MFTPEFIEQLADAVAEKLEARLEKRTVTNRLMTVAEAAPYIRKTKQALYHLVNKSKIPVKRIGTKVYFDRLALDAWIESLTD